MPFATSFDSRPDGWLGEMNFRLRDVYGALGADKAVASLRDLQKNASKIRWEEVLAGAAGWMERLPKMDASMLEGFRFVMESTIAGVREMMARRQKGEYPVDEFGMDTEFLDLVRPMLTFLHSHWWRVEVTGLEHVPAEGPALLVANHSGVLPWDGAMIAYSVWKDHPAQRTVRSLYLDWFQSIPYIQPFLARTGQVFACPENAERLLRSGQLTCVFPEGVKGVGKLFKDRYRLARFGRGGYVRTAIRGKAPIIPVSVVGAEETYPNLLRLDLLGKLIGAPYMVVTPTFPWLGLLGLIPLPSKWHIHFGKPVRTDEMKERDAANFLTVGRISRDVRDTIQKTIRKHLKARKSVFA